MCFSWVSRAILLSLLLPLGGVAAAPSDAVARQHISASLVRPEAERMRPYRWQREPEFVLLYFGADWCAACHALSPELIQLRTALRQAGADTEVVYVSLDESEAQMRRYMRRQNMPWPALDRRRAKGIPGLRRLQGIAPPNVVLLDRQGRPLASAWQGRYYLGPQVVMRRWVEAVGAMSSPGQEWP